MERGFYRDRLEATHHLQVLVPAEADRALVHRVIYDELVQGVISDASRGHLKAPALSILKFGPCASDGQLMSARRSAGSGAA
jgi:aspartate racemase